MKASPHMDVAAYILGVLDEEDSEAFERHLPACESCQIELRELYGMPALLDLAKGSAVAQDGVEADTSAPTLPPRSPTRKLTGLLDDVTVARMRRRRTKLIAASVAATVLVVGSTATAWGWTALQDALNEDTASVGLTGGPQPAADEVLTSSDPVTGAAGTVTLVSKGWGTEVGLELSGLAGPLRCRLIAISTTGDTDVVTSWQVAEGSGYGVPDHPDPLRIQGGTAFDSADIHEFQVRADDGTRLLAVPADGD